MGALRKGWRQFQRVIPATEQPVSVRVEQPDGLDGGQVCDISEGGIELLLPAPATRELTGRGVSLTLTLPDSSQVRIQGEIRHVEERRVGVVFLGLSQLDRERIRRYIQKQAGAASLWTLFRRLLAP